MKPKTAFRSFLTSVIVAAGSCIMQAQYAEDALRFSQYGFNPSARTLGMGGVAVGVADDFSALFANPAGLAQLRSYEFSIGLGRSSFNNDVTYLGTLTPSGNSATNLSHIGIVYPIPTARGSLTFAFGYGRVADYTSIATIDGTNPNNSIIQTLTPSTNLNTLSATARRDFLDNDVMYQLYLADVDTLSAIQRLVPLVRGGLRQTATVLEGGGMNSWSFGGAVDIAKNLSLGITVNFQSGSYSYDRKFVETDPSNIYNSYVYLTSTDLERFTWESTIRSDLSGFNALFGLMYRRPGRLRIGASVRTPTTYEISENFTDNYESRFDNGDAPPPMTSSGSTKYKVVTPMVLSAGVSVQPVDWLALAGDAEYTDWTQTQFDSDNPDLVEENRNMKLSYFRDTWNLRGGAEVTLFDLGLKLRGGVGYNPSPYKVDASISDRNPVYYTAGAGFTFDGSTTINVGYAYGQWKTFRYNYQLAGAAQQPTTNESVGLHNIQVSLSYRF